MSELTLKSVEEEAADCRARCSGLKVGDPILHLHHEVLLESLREPIEDRIDYILECKTDNPALRLRMMGPLREDKVSLSDSAWIKANAAWNKAYAAWSKADAARIKANAAWNKAYAAWSKADAARIKAYAAWIKAEAARSKAYAASIKADAELSKAYEKHYKRLFPDSPWDGKTIFSGRFSEKNRYGKAVAHV